MRSDLRVVTVAALLLVGAVGGCNCQPEPGGDDAGDSGNPDGEDGGPDGGPGPGEDGGDAGPDGGGPEQPSGCPAYQLPCDGGCVASTVDPLNCGGCGVACTGNQVCSQGSCADSCPAGLSPCGNACVDLKSDSAHCGACGNDCGAGEGCVNGSCQPALGQSTRTGCEGGGAPIEVLRPDGGSRCAADQAQVTFRWGLCSCQDVQFTNVFLVDAFDSTRGAYAPGGHGGGVGLNGAYDSTGNTTIWGALWASSGAGIQTQNPTDIKLELHSGGPLSASNPMNIGGDAFANGSVTTSSSIDIAGSLHLPEGATVGSGVTAAGLVREVVTVPEPCDCRPEQRVPVAEIIASRAGQNDNASIGLASDALSSVDSAVRLDLPCGHFFLDAIQANAPLSIIAHGRTALYIQGDLTGSSELELSVRPGAELDIFVGGTLATTGQLRLGNRSFPAMTRIYVGGTTGLSFTDKVAINGFFYAAQSQVAVGNGFDVAGGLYVGDFTSTDVTAIHYDRQVLRVGEGCAPGDGGIPASGCQGCQDCGNQACVDGACGACTDSSQCCSPLVCAGGSCVPASCPSAGESCSPSSPCCTGLQCLTSQGFQCDGSTACACEFILGSREEPPSP